MQEPCNQQAEGPIGEHEKNGLTNGAGEKDHYASEPSGEGKPNAIWEQRNQPYGNYETCTFGPGDGMPFQHEGVIGFVGQDVEAPREDRGAHGNGNTERKDEQHSRVRHLTDGAQSAGRRDGDPYALMISAQGDQP